MSEVRDLGFLAWKDPDAWMEKMRGPQWEALVNEENQRLQRVLHGKDDLIAKFKNELADAAKIYEWEVFGNKYIRITPLSAFSIKWRFDGETNYTFARDLDTNNKVIAYTHDIGKGSELFELVVQDIHTQEVLWRRSPVGPTVSIQIDKIYYLGVSQKLWYNKLLSCTLLTGANIQEKYDEKDAHYNLSLERRSRADAAILVRENSGKTDSFYICDNSLTPVAPGSEKQLVIDNEYYYYRNHTDNKYKTSEYISENINNTDFQGTPVSTNGRLTFVTREHGESRLYILEQFGYYIQHSLMKHIKHGTITLSPFNDDFNILIDEGTAPPYCIQLFKKTPQSPHKGTFKLKAHKVNAISSDGTEVYGTLLHNANITRPKALFAVGYGAYGVPSSPAGAYAKWTPLLKREWGVLYTYIRGGGDHTDGWAQAGRLEGRTHTRDDFLALVEAAQKQFKIPAANTVIYGRSAGGFLMGMCLNKEPTGRLFGAVYTEVPYVDLLRTTTNPALPLTKMEYNEFGDPAHRPEDFGFLVDLSPADVAITTEAPNVFVLARTGLNDSQVYAYEPVKWIRRLRKPGDKEEKVIGIARGEGHFYSGEVALEAKAEDLAILHSRIFPFTPSA